MFRGDDADARIVIDPIDGTLHYYLGAQGPYAVMAGLAFGGRYAASLVALPREGWLFQAVRGDGARRTWIGGEARTMTGVVGQSPGDRAALSREGARVLLSDGVPEAVAERLAASGFETLRACGGAVAVAPLVPGVRGGVRVAKPSQPSISTRGRIGLLIAAEAGAVIETASGAPFPDALDEPASALVVASGADIAAALRAAIEA